jgi:hypothetical protein
MEGNAILPDLRVALPVTSGATRFRTAIMGSGKDQNRVLARKRREV